MAGIYTNTGLVKHAQKALALNTKYMWGGILRPITTSYINMLRSTYGNRAGTGYTNARYNELAGYVGKNYYGCDCVGLIKSYYWSGKTEGGTGSPNYGAKGYPDVNAGTMYSAAKVKGKINTMPERQGLIVYCRTYPHVGVYIGNGYVIESTLSNRGDGVVKTKLSDFSWEYWFECPYIEYVPNGEPVVPANDKGKYVQNIYQATSNAAIREGMSKSTKIYGRVTNGDYYTVDRLYDNWIKYTNRDSYSMLKDGSELFKKVGEYKVMRTADKLNVRVKPSVTADKMTVLQPTTIVFVWNETPVQKDGYHWVKIIIEDKIGYVASEYLK